MKKRKVRDFVVRQLKEWGWIVIVVVLVIVPVKSSLADWNWVPSGSMHPTIIEGDLVYVNKLAYDLRVPLTLLRVNQWADPQRGDIIVLFSPEDGRRLVKRVIGVPGDEIEMKNNVLYVNGRAMEYSDLPASEGRDLPAELRWSARFAEEDLEGTPHSVMFVPGVDFGQRSFSRKVVPAGKFFVMGDSRDFSHDSRFFGFADRHLIIGRATSVIISVDKAEGWRPRWNRFFTSLN